MDIAGLTKDLDRVAKKQKTNYAQAREGLATLTSDVERAREQLASQQPVDVAAVELLLRINRLDLATKCEASFKELYACVGKLGKTIEKCFPNEISKVTSAQFDQGLLNQVIAHHLYREGHFEIGDLFVQEAGVEGASQLKEPFSAMHDVLRAMAKRDLEPALRWAQVHRERVAEHGAPPLSAAFEFRLHALRYLALLTTGGRAPALAYARSAFGPFRFTHLADITRLAGAALYAETLDSSPYRDLAAGARWDDAAAAFRAECCSSLGVPASSPLSSAVNAGAVALPTLLKLSAVMGGKAGGWGAGETLPVEIELGPEFAFRSVFACPVSREQSGPENPPLLLPCGHVLCKQSVARLAKGAAKAFKCPYCPTEATVAQCRPITL